MVRLLISILLTIACAGRSYAEGAPALDLKVTPNFGGAGKADLLAVYKSASQTIWRHCPDAEVPPVQVRHSPGGPIVLFQRAANGDLQVELSAKGTYWAQHAYQFAHETCHILCRFKDADKTNMWFEESLCETASLFALRQMAKEWATEPPYPNWRSYSKALRDYADNIMNDPKHQLPADGDFRSWWRDNRATLAASHVLRDKNTIVAMQLLPLLERQPANWQALYYLNLGRNETSVSFEEYLRRWHYHCPDRFKPFVDDVRAVFFAE